MTGGDAMREKSVPSIAVKDEAGKSSFFEPSNIILLIAVILAACWIVKLSKEQMALKNSMAEAEGTLSGPQSSQAGDIVPPFKTVNLAGEPAEITYNGSSKYLLFIFSPGCDACQSDIPKLKSISSRVPPDGYSLRAISIDPIDESRQRLRGKDIAAEVLIMPNMAVQRTYRVVSIPQTMIVSSKGQVEWVHYGALTDDDISVLISKLSA
jgi:cytochrome c biogenesis protein CcmG/thiol:disulfide interchange protein DsbE